MSHTTKNSPCIYTVPPEQNINTYLTTVSNILVQLKGSNDKDTAINRIDTLISHLTTVINKNQLTLKKRQIHN